MNGEARLDEIRQCILSALDGLDNIITEQFALGGDLNIRMMLYHAVDLTRGGSDAR